MAFTLNRAFRILRQRAITEMQVGLPEIEITADRPDKWAVYSYKKELLLFASIPTATSAAAERASSRS
ncbi:hypothetical protein FXB40_11445 [Bradyrhizobium rifense]|uniref:Uncharacterized protein n=1 Tax=Bradyrhizobium rifense TaxID=515499 RepID=A0A5D3KUE6_9BRAD|nr:hypothetical protein [Bradyrhizobium rifense]TYL96647.1 hypothetical protein FXB40_11445 [Bradyrhizobium rifense]